MAAPRKILTVFGTRPEAIKLFPLVHRLARDDRFIGRVCISAQHREMLDQVLDIAGIVPDHDLDLMTPGQTLDALTARALVEIGKVLDLEQPDWVVVQGDTTTVMAGAIAAYYRKIPVCHVEAGLRSGDIHHPWPEEVNRRVVGSFAALHCAPTTTARDALLRENVDPATVHVTGNTVIDALQWVTARVGDSPALADGLRALEERFAGRRIIGVTSHRRENFGEGMQAIAKAVKSIASRQDVAVIFPVHLNPQVRAVMKAELAGLDNVALLEPLDYPQFARLLDISHLMLTDSGGVQEEAPALGKPVLVMRETTERPEGIAAGTARLVGTDADRIVRETNRLLDDPAAYAAMAQAHNPFGDGHAAERIADLLAAS
ncbi:MAG TPA: UDP-N-acetylglucosamine 2-epimerase (non-hydrolyzing) [Erythrobacter sp.]|jgi:UDP-N-acetylglucosamine 2-epimerase (non-hydrolysing)|uniref:UDP-N-acetylglucosamine 2-epimerase (non-hydrolyzing) n=1 Tax=Qipengyuania citrea LAMA 915 TaxID=1306953 RepID=A0A0L1K9Z6_9SPHN|nr:MULTISPECIES: UDP-N-acetylglucosamine 2-epimerase (non-hydrolyzing) [Erythrobacteraceae]MDP7326030.1 UDP-N-acetylglucosamine 2-epimerase (non-hydrolyzing) [Qipengyuania citrea]HBC16147.1 UDP-N-acetylglucosamine 2-epimerase (non-hydrolyzing) [Erythrobacter sp.]KNH00672.1 udp-n-acetylglucosamine 2-epimerase [Qipengyuania citrea LAMA 915]KZY92375.1 UDP-N-acetyl glucosamine 2-epimerase [Erythrobacter sp. HI0074]KZZ09033.1 UDP-N-acetyl glucosamine 2-epimerase [Erythrobacter sp. HI0077]|tara:strand:- start:1577 stop:2701 length:1125 start_codon:yes stop_codon:yes gene_type:complete